MSNNQRFTVNDFYCVVCGNKGLNVVRKNGAQREAGHLKKLYCIHCRRETNHAEVRPFGDYNYEDFKEEYECGRFVNEQRVPLAELEICKDKDCPYSKNDRCWNANHSFKCSYRTEEKDLKEEQFYVK